MCCQYLGPRHNDVFDDPTPFLSRESAIPHGNYGALDCFNSSIKETSGALGTDSCRARNSIEVNNSLTAWPYAVSP
jgi:hypothetical protein